MACDAVTLQTIRIVHRLHKQTRPLGSPNQDRPTGDKPAASQRLNLPELPFNHILAVSGPSGLIAPIATTSRPPVLRMRLGPACGALR
jgi:hypothetical protein